MKRIILLVMLLLLLVVSNVFASTYYISPTGSDSTGTGATATPWATLTKAFSKMLGGDTLIIKDGTYTGNSNFITSGNLPPVGASGAWTIIKAQNDGAAIFDGQNTQNLFNFDTGTAANRYWQFEGIIWCRNISSNVMITGSNYVKFLRCGAYDAGNNNNINLDIGRRSSYILLENCYAFGSGRYKFGAYQSNHIIFRQCVGRLDRVVAPSDPAAVFTVYSCDDSEVQNCIAIDTDQTSYFSTAEYGGAYYLPCTDMDGNRINITNSVALNVKLGGSGIGGKDTYKTSDVNFKNCVFWDMSAPSGDAMFNWRGLRVKANNCTFGKCSYNYYGITSYDGIGYDNATTIKNSIVYNFTNKPALYDVETEDYNALYANTSNYVNMTGGSHDKSTTNPIWNASTNPSGALKYIVQIEASSNLVGQGESGVDIGADCTWMIGAPGTLYGEAGYNTEQTTSMWPFPNEDLIRTKMKAYNAGGVSGNRGFCADGTTLTKYIWEYLGNTIPTDIYAGVTPTPTPVPEPTPVPVPEPTPVPTPTPTPTPTPVPVPPTAISDLMVSKTTTSSAVIMWTAPKDSNGNAVARYDIRYSLVYITESNFNTSLKVSRPPTPAAPGTKKSLIISGLKSGTLYYFAIKSKSSAGLFSSVSNVPSAKTITKTSRYH